MCVQEMDWLVLQHVLEVLPMLMQNRSLLMAAQAEDVEKLCQRLCNLVSDTLHYLCNVVSTFLCITPTRTKVYLYADIQQ